MHSQTNRLDSAKPRRHKVVTVERGTDAEGRRGYAARCEEPGCGAITFGGFPSRSAARAELHRHEDEAPVDPTTSQGPAIADDTPRGSYAARRRDDVARGGDIATLRIAVRTLRETDKRWRMLRQIASELAVRVHFADIGPEFRGLYDHEDGRIYLDLALTPRELLSTLAHEVAHAIFGHVATLPATEEIADAWAAQFLIDDQDWVKLVSVSNSTPWLASQLGVIDEVVRTYRECADKHRTADVNAIALHTDALQVGSEMTS